MRKHNANTRLYTTNEEKNKKHYLHFSYTISNLIKNNIELLHFFNYYIDVIIGHEDDKNTYRKYYLRWDDDEYSASYQDISDYNETLKKQYHKSIFLLGNKFCLRTVLHKVNEIMAYSFSDIDT